MRSPLEPASALSTAATALATSAGVNAQLLVSEIFNSIQGEGPSQGEPCTFLRLAGCNLACTWCDTEYSWNWKRFDVRTHASSMGVGQLSERLMRAGRVVITGGEPLLQQRALERLFSQLGSEPHLEIETNGTVVPSLSLLERVNQWNVSPKLSNSGEQQERRINTSALTELRGTSRAWLKLVVNSPNDTEECLALIQELEWPEERVYLMPQCRTRDELVQAAPPVEDMASKHGLLFTSRLHLQLWNGARGH